MKIGNLKFIDPMKFKERMWPRVRFYKEQWDIVYSIVHNVETYVVAGNKLGKDFVTGFICPWFFVSAIHTRQTCKIVTTSVKDEHLDVLWGEIGRFITTAEMPLVYTKDTPEGCLTLNYHEIRRASEIHAKNPLNYLKGMVSKNGEGMSGHHADITLFVGDEASGIANVAYEGAQGWAKRFLLIGNPNPCNNFFREAVKAGDLLAS